jgi:phosphopantothenoylcysteine decarboxylase / phosphopantothenate---cysteine ligase
LPDSELLAGVRVVVTAGGTREPVDPVRYLGNRSSGKMGTALAHAASGYGAQVTLVTTVEPALEMHLERIVRVDTAAEMHDALRARLSETDLLLMAAAVADWQPAEPSPRKLKKHAGEWLLRLLPTPDILTALREEPARDGVFVVGFAAETEDLIDNARAKLQEKGLDLIVVNDVGRPDIGMGAEDNEVTVIDAGGIVARLERASKRRIAEQLLRIVADRLRR